MHVCVIIVDKICECEFTYLDVEDWLKHMQMEIYNSYKFRSAIQTHLDNWECTAK